MKTTKAANVNEYINSFPKATQKVLEQVRKTIKKAAPAAEESINYAMPAYKLNGKPLVYFAGYENHIGLYATPSGHTAFEEELSKYKQGKGSVQFPLDGPMPLDLITRIVKFRAQGNEEKEKNFLSLLSAPARRALENNGIKTLQQLSKHSEKEIMKFHGVGKTTIPVLQKALKEKGLDFQNGN
ncbi:MAG: DUF1801 domain-containing protein [Ginsengibacter sp.]